MLQKFLILINHNLPIFLLYFYCSSFCGPPCNKYCNVLTTYCEQRWISLAAVSVANVSKTHLGIDTTPWSHGTSPRPLTYVYKVLSGFMQGKAVGWWNVYYLLISCGFCQNPHFAQVFFHPFVLSSWFSVYSEKTMLLSLCWWISVQCHVGVEECLPACAWRANCSSTVLVWKLSSSCWIIMIAFHKPCAGCGLVLCSAPQVSWHCHAWPYWRYLMVDPDGKWL